VMRPILLAGPAAPPWAMAELGSGGVFEFCPLEAGRETTLQGVKVQPFALPHLIESYGLRLRAEGKTFAYSGDTGATDEVQALARGAHNPVIASMLLVITPDVLRYYQRYRVCTVPQEEVYFEHRELLRCVREKDEEGAVAMQRRHLKSLSEFAAAFNDENHFLE
jgi:hypothetical protein